MAGPTESEMKESAQFTPLIIESDEHVCITLPEKGIVCEAATITEAYQKYRQAIELRRSQEDRYGSDLYVTEPFPLKRNRHLVHEFIIFWLKIASGIVLSVVLIVILLPAIRASADHHFSSFLSGAVPDIPETYRSAKYWGIDFPRSLNERFDNLTPDEMLDMRHQWNALWGRVMSIVPSEYQAIDKLKAIQ